MNCHFGTRSLNADGSWKDLSSMPNSAADISPTGSQMPRLVGLAYASKVYRELEPLGSEGGFSRKGGEIAFGTIGNASCAEGMFWESVNAIGVLEAPALISIWDDGYGISVPNEFQVTKANVGELLSGFQRRDGERSGFDIYTVKGWDYPTLIETYINAAAIVRMEHVPAIIHVTEVTQPQGHSTSGSHERYKSKERLEWEIEYCCVRRMRNWMIEQGIATGDELDRFEKEDLAAVREAQRSAWAACRQPIEADKQRFVEIARELAAASPEKEKVESTIMALERMPAAMRRDIARAAMDVLVEARAGEGDAFAKLVEWRRDYFEGGRRLYGSNLLSESGEAAVNVPAVAPLYSDSSPTVNGFEVVNACFDKALERDPSVVAFGEDVGRLGDVNQGFAGLQDVYGQFRVSDTGIRECTIMGQAIGMAMRGLRPIAEIQYLDYVLYGLQILSDDLASLRWRTDGGQKAPVIVRTRGHRLEGIWHSGSQMSALLALLRGMHVCVPRNMTQAAGFYNTLLQSDDPAIVVEVLNGYRVKEKLPDNVGEFTVALGVPEILREGSDVTLVTYGATCRIVLEAAELLADVGVDAEVIDVQTLLPFDIPRTVATSVRKTSRVCVIDEDVPGGASAYLMQNVLERDGAYEWLDSAPRTVTAAAHRPAYGSDGDYFSKPGREEIFEAVYAMMHEADPSAFPMFF
jgi:pyruvate/2-oxoglutarate/acetoin dehydrogenase E1 component/TPP-dependent pyruvate/acetoin dehydrogenase alpha subunit